MSESFWIAMLITQNRHLSKRGSFHHSKLSRCGFIVNLTKIFSVVMFSNPIDFYTNVKV